MNQEKFPARIHVLLARDKKVGVVIRRGPSKNTCVLSWDRTKNKFKVSQWVKGRIYERRSDISPNGSYLIYFALNGKWDSEVMGSWTAVSRAPWLKAITLFAKGDGWNGGGLFLNDNEYWLNDGHGHKLLSDTKEVRRNISYSPANYYGGECLTIYYNRLQRDGWKLIERLERGKWNSVTIFNKGLSKNWILVKIAHEQVGPPKGKGCYWDEHELLNDQGETIRQPAWEWAEWVDGKLVWAQDGCIYSSNIMSSKRIGEAKLLHDFNEYKFKRLNAPY